MPINVICRGCHARFSVSEKFAGKKGPCPKCKAIIEIPLANEEVVVHEPEHSEVGARGSGGQLVLKPIERKETVIQPMVIAGYAAGAVLLLIMALVFRKLEDKSLVLVVGAVVLAPPLVWGGYCMLRDDEELEPFAGLALWTRVAICSLGYALLWWVFSFVYGRFFGEDAAEIWNLALLAPVFLFLGAGLATVSFDFDLGVGFFHYSLYLVVTVVLRMLMGLPVAGPMPIEAPPVSPPTPFPTPNPLDPGKSTDAVSWLTDLAQLWIS